MRLDWTVPSRRPVDGSEIESVCSYEMACGEARIEIVGIYIK